MKAEQFNESLNKINDKYIEEAVTYGTSFGKEIVSASTQGAEKNYAASSSKPFRAMKVWRAVAIAACALLAAGIGVTAIGLSLGNKGSSGTAQAPINNESYYEDSFTANGAYDTEAGAYNTTEEVAEEDSAKAGGISSMLPQNENAKIIYSTYLDVDTKAFDDTQKDIESVTKAHNGYFENLEQDSYSAYRNAYYVIRVPADQFDSFMSEIQKVGTVTSISQNAADISETYVDIESRLETAKAKLARLQELLSQAQDLSDIITIENEIADVQYEIDELSGTLKSYDSQVEYSSVTLNLHEVYRTTEGDSPISFGERIKTAFSNGVKGFTDGMEDILVFFAASWLWLLLIGVVIAVVIIIIVKATRKNRSSKK